MLNDSNARLLLFVKRIEIFHTYNMPAVLNLQLKISSNWVLVMRKNYYRAKIRIVIIDYR